MSLSTYSIREKEEQKWSWRNKYHHYTRPDGYNLGIIWALAYMLRLGVLLSTGQQDSRTV